MALNIMRINLFYAFLFSLYVMVSCTTTKKTVKDTGPVILDSGAEAASMFQLIQATDVPYTWFSGDGSGTIDWDGQRYNARMRVRIEYDKVIWVQIQKFGFELGRMFITPDSAFFINRLDRTYSIYSTTAFLKKYNLPADFNMFSKVFTGGAYIPPAISKSVVEDDKSLYLESNTGVNARHWLDVSSILVRSLVTDPYNHEWAAGFGDYRATNTGEIVPYQRTNTLVIDGTTNLFNLDYSSIEINVPQELPFSIPSHYEKI
jgi:hypothetical protein